MFDSRGACREDSSRTAWGIERGTVEEETENFVVLWMTTWWRRKLHNQRKLGDHSKTSCAAHPRGCPPRNQTHLARGSILVGGTGSPVACECLQETAQGARPYRHVPHSNVIVAGGARGHVVGRARDGQVVRVVQRLGVVGVVAAARIVQFGVSG